MAEIFRMKWINGITSDAVRHKTGRTWEQWSLLLDRAGGRMMECREIAEWLRRRHRLPLWWSRTIASGYAVERGLRQPHQRGKGYGIDRAKTIATPLMKVWTAWRNPAIREHWLPEARFELRRMRYRKSLHLRWPDGSRVSAVFQRRLGKTKVVVSHRTLAERADVERMKIFWAAALQRLQAMLTAPRR
jgi:Domain of unknown function (DUF4287)